MNTRHVKMVMRYIGIEDALRALIHEVGKAGVKDATPELYAAVLASIAALNVKLPPAEVK